MATFVAPKVRSWTLAIMFAVFVGGSTVTAIAPTTASALNLYTCADGKATQILSFPLWYRGLTADDGKGAKACELVSPDTLDTKAGKANNGLSNFIWIIVLNITEIGLQLAAYIAVGFILYGGFQFMTSQGSPDGATKARKTILNAVIGLVISFASIGAANLMFEIIK